MPDRTILLCPYNHSQQLKGVADGTNTYPRDPIQEEENDYKMGVKRNKGERMDPEHTGSTKKSSSDRAEDQFYLGSLAHEEHRDGHCPFIAQLFGPLSTNSLYRARWSKDPCILGLA